MSTTFLQAVNSVLSRLRETAVTAVSETTYSSLIAKLVNDTKRSVEDAWNWNALYTTIPVTTVAGTHTYTMTGAGYRLKIDTVNDSTNRNILRPVPLAYILHQQQLATTSLGRPTCYAFKGMSGDDAQIILYPTPDGTSTININCWVPQIDLVASADVLVVPAEAIILGAYARALAERGEDGGLSSSEAYGLYASTLSDQIAIDASRGHETEWVVT